jgi:hypothetical protein
MTDQRLRELLDEHVADLTTVDLVDGAWQQARTVRRRRRATAAAAAAVVAVVGTTAVVASRSDDGTMPPVTSPSGTTTPRSDEGPKAVRSGTYGGAPVWWAPTTTEEADLPRLDGTALPAVIDLSDGRPAWPGGMRAVALLQLWGDEPGAVVVVGEDGTSYSLDVSRLGRVRDGGGNDYPPVGPMSLSPDGRTASFRQEGALEVYDLVHGGWRTEDFRPLDGEGGIAGPAEGDESYGPTAWSRGASGARGVYLAGPVPAPTGDQRSVDAIVVVDGTLSGHPLLPPYPVLAFPDNRADDGRWLQCCPPVGWLDNETLLFESRWAEAKVLAWKVGTPDVYRVSDIVGWTPGAETYVASFAALD